MSYFDYLVFGFIKCGFSGEENIPVTLLFLHSKGLAYRRKLKLNRIWLYVYEFES